MNDIDNIYENIYEYNLNQKRKILILFNDWSYPDSWSAKQQNLNLIVTELIIRGRKLNIPVVFIRESHFFVPKNIKLNSTHYFIMKIPNKQEFHQILTLVHFLQSHIMF